MNDKYYVPMTYPQCYIEYNFDSDSDETVM